MNPRAIVLLIHGLTQRAESLNAFAEQLAADKFLIYGIDQRGHGAWHSADRVGKDGYHCDYKATTKDVDRLIAVLHREFPGRPLYLVGESIGSAVALRAATDKGSNVNGLVLCAFGGKMNNFKVRWVVRDMIHILFHPTEGVAMARYQVAYACENPQTLKITMSDPKARKSLGGFEVLRSSNFVAKNLKFAAKLSPQTPILLLKGADDKIVTKKSAQSFYDHARSSDKSLALVPGSGHMLIGRPDIAPSTVSFIKDWINNEVVSQKAAMGSNEQL